MPSLPRSPFGRRAARSRVAERAPERDEPLQAVQYLFDRVRSSEDLREDLFSKGPGYLLYRIVDDAVDASFPMLRKIGNKLERIEEDIFEEEGGSNEVVRDISNVKQEIINFRKII